MLYTVIPLERIYSNHNLNYTTNKSVNKNGLSEKDYKEMELDYGKLYARKEGDQYVVDGIQSTDMRDYLKSEYIPGTIVNKPMM